MFDIGAFTSGLLTGLREGVEAALAGAGERLDLRRIRLHREEHHLLAGDLFGVLDEAVPNFGVDGGVFDGYFVVHRVL